MPPESPSSGSIGARRQFDNIVNKVNALDRTINQLQALPGLPSSIVDRLEELSRTKTDLYIGVRNKWQAEEKELGETVNALPQLEQRTQQLRQNQEPQNARVEQVKRQVAEHRTAVERNPSDNTIRATLNALEKQFTELTENLGAHNAALQKADSSLAELKTRRANQERDFEKFATTPLPEFDLARQKVDQLLEDARRLYDEATRNRSLAAAGETVATNTAQFKSALAHHQGQARNLFWLTLASAIAFAAFIAIVFLHAPTGEMTAASDGKIDWPHALVVLGGRLSIVIGGGWLVTFIGRLHSRHSQQSVSYQDRLAGMDVIGLLLQHGTQETRDAMMKRITEFYLSQDDNAFRDLPTREPSLRDVERLLRSVTKPVAEAVKAVGGKLSKP